MHDGAEPPFPYPLLEALRGSPGSPAFEHGDRLISRGELLDLIRRLAAALQDAGLGPGRGVALRTGVSPEAFAVHMAAHALGCRVLCVRPGYSPRLLAHVLGLDIDAVVVDETTMRPELLSAAGPATVLSLGPVAGALDLLAHPGGDGFPAVTARPDDVALLTFTSGSTGEPKGCALTYRGLGTHWSWQPGLWSPLATAFAESFERFLLFGTLSSTVILDYLLLCLLGGGTAVIPEEGAGPLFPHAIERHRITGSVMAAPRLAQMLDLLRDRPAGLSGLRALVIGGSPLSPHRLTEAMRRLGPVVYNGYGTTESGLISMLTPGDIARFPGRAPASVGRPHSLVEISVRDEEGRPVATGRTGEIFVRTPYQMTGYWGRPEESREALLDGWLRTRDLGHLDETGLLYLVGRARDIILVNAAVVYAGPIERVLAGHPGVAEAYVAGAPDERTGEAVHAFIVPAAGRSPEPDALRELVRADLGEESVPRTVTTVPAVPVAASGKPDKSALLQRYGPAVL
ncbi:AMP-dependent synthetase [Sphaerisporangium melleum]|uniref:AMP-dependent synthetase n=1 Tax=Sphaerisporangium melleum TaxID=321316 RepID=A0A917RIF8_9ACTN|nr:AMP-binding protein [Sphaerisporangium melleum]GGL08054.1 AMP-dependent synthetase [Sphaerisporangium melleum]GII74299.1 AMP-dependent synthetase [Sphaerisporangium melleum]